MINLFQLVRSILDKAIVIFPGCVIIIFLKHVEVKK
jgi:hypothetical protein